MRGNVKKSRRVNCDANAACSCMPTGIHRQGARLYFVTCLLNCRLQFWVYARMPREHGWQVAADTCFDIVLRAVHPFIITICSLEHISLLPFRFFSRFGGSRECAKLHMPSKRSCIKGSNYKDMLQWHALLVLMWSQNYHSMCLRSIILFLHNWDQLKLCFMTKQIRLKSFWALANFFRCGMRICSGAIVWVIC